MGNFGHSSQHLDTVCADFSHILYIYVQHIWMTVLYLLAFYAWRLHLFLPCILFFSPLSVFSSAQLFSWPVSSVIIFAYGIANCNLCLLVDFKLSLTLSSLIVNEYA